jgi:NAD(P)-dependent dehydrogenase (short-subunit alcohol dehydrogenase family)
MTRGDLTGKVALVTGAARGLGQGICAVLAARGADVIATDAARCVTGIQLPVDMGATTV